MADNYANPLKEAETDITKAQKAINGLLEPKQEAKAEEPKEQNSPEPQEVESEEDQPQEQEIKEEETESQDNVEEETSEDVSQDEEQIDTQEMLITDKRLKNFLIRENNFNLSLKSKDKTILKNSMS